VEFAELTAFLARRNDANLPELLMYQCINATESARIQFILLIVTPQYLTPMWGVGFSAGAKANRNPVDVDLDRLKNETLPMLT
jgi:hypothetical protein